MKNKLLQQGIPDGWKLFPAGDIFSFVKSYAFSRDNLINDTLNNEGIGNIHYGDIHATFSSPSIDLKRVSIPKIKDTNFMPKSEDYLKDGDLIMADASEDYEGVGVTVSIHGLEDKKVVGGLHTFVLRDSKQKTNKYFRQYIFRNPKIRNSLQKVANGVSVYGISKTAVSRLLLPIPPLPEQNRIVAILETWDKVIEKLTKKIEIKKKIKRGLMQELLSGRTRLSGFKDKWTTVKLGNVVEIVSGGTPDTNTASFWNGEVNWITPTEITKIGKYITNDTEKKITKSGLQSSSALLIPEGSLILCSRATIGACAINTYPIATNQGFKNLIPSNAIFVEFLYYKIKISKNLLLRISSGSTFMEFSKKDISKMKLDLPPISEQKAIANILTLADKEIEKLERKLSLLKNQKKYLLNNLITGTIRTPENLTSNA